MMAFPEVDGLFKNLVNHVAIGLGLTIRFKRQDSQD